MRRGRRHQAALGLLLSLALAGCATRGPSEAEQDPMEGSNRAVFAFNDGLDRVILEPLGRGWAFITPEFVPQGLDNFFANLAFPVRFVSSLLQGRLVWGGTELGRFLLNTTVGVAGFVDVASYAGIEPHEEDFGQAFGAWGIPSGAYWMIPFYGPSNPRDTVGAVFDAAFNVAPWFTLPIRVINDRTMVLDEVEAMREAALDYYVSVRNGYIQLRRAQVRNETLLEEEEEEDLYDVEAFNGDEEL